MIKIIPKNGLKVINPQTLKALPKDGILITQLSTFWRNRLKDGDVEAKEVKKTSRKASINKEK